MRWDARRGVKAVGGDVVNYKYRMRVMDERFPIWELMLHPLGEIFLNLTCELHGNVDGMIGTITFIRDLGLRIELDLRIGNMSFVIQLTNQVGQLRRARKRNFNFA
jgi:hypothetical protein